MAIKITLLLFVAAVFVTVSISAGANDNRYAYEEKAIKPALPVYVDDDQGYKMPSNYQGKSYPDEYQGSVGYGSKRISENAVPPEEDPYYAPYYYNYY